MVMLAHATPPQIVYEIRSFDVVMLVLISGMSMVQGKPQRYSLYLKQRAKKLIVPTYCIIVFVLVALLTGSLLTNSFSISVDYVLNSLLLINGNSIGFVWIAKVYILIALLKPALVWVNRKIENSTIIYLLTSVTVAIFTVIYMYVSGNAPSDNVFLQILYVLFEEYILYAVAFACVALAGMRLNQDVKSDWICFVVYTTAYAISSFALSIDSFNPSEYKYPPQISYIAYGVMVAVIMVKLAGFLQKALSGKCVKLHAFIEWFSRNSYTIYLVHILCMWGMFMAEKISAFSALFSTWYIRLAYIYISSAVVTFIYLKIKTGIMKKGTDKSDA